VPAAIRAAPHSRWCGAATLLRMNAGKGAAAELAVVLIDDHAVVRAALRALLEGQDGIVVAGEAGDLASAREVLRETEPAVVVLDVNLPDGLGSEAVSGLREEFPQTQVVLLTMERDLTLARPALDAGALGYLFKDAAHLELVEAVRAAAAGERCVSAAVDAGLAKGGGEAERQALSPRETEVLRLMALGHTNREIGEQLELSVRTVETHRAHIQQKLGLSSRPELTRYALANRLIDV
jgi:two-component system, NarL family, response regulator NreC